MLIDALLQGSQLEMNKKNKSKIFSVASPLQVAYWRLRSWWWNTHRYLWKLWVRKWKTIETTAIFWLVGPIRIEKQQSSLNLYYWIPHHKFDCWTDGRMPTSSFAGKKSGSATEITLPENWDWKVKGSGRKWSSQDVLGHLLSVHYFFKKLFILFFPKR